MCEDKEKGEGKIEGAINAVTGLVKAVPIYEDAIQPAAKQIGKTLETVTKAVNLVLAPVTGLVWGYEQIENCVQARVSEKLRNTPEGEIISPKPNVAGPALEALRYVGHEESLRELYANLLAASMDAATAYSAHPSFVEIIKQITPDEAKLLKLFSSERPFPLLSVRANLKNNAGGADMLVNFSILGEEANCENLNLVSSYIDNLCRLGLIDVPVFFEYIEQNIYAPLENHPTVKKITQQISETSDRVAEVQRKGARTTQLGKQFINACVTDHASKRVSNII